jgi:hypothetical protein
MAKSPRLVVIPRSPHRRLAEAVAPVGTPLGKTVDMAYVKAKRR